MYTNVNWAQATGDALLNFWAEFLMFVPNLIGALIVFIIGWFVAVAIGKIISEILIRIRFNQIFETGDWKKALGKAEVKVHPAEFIGDIAKWILIIIFLMVAVDILGIAAFASFLANIVAYLSNVVAAAFMFVVAVIVAEFLAKVIVATTAKASFEYSQVAGEIVRWSIWIFAILAILHQLGVAQPLVETLFSGIIGVIVISVGLAFGLGGKDAAAEAIDSVRKRLMR